MIRNLRTRHRWLTRVLGVVAVLAYVGAIASRPDPVPREAVPAPLQGIGISTGSDTALETVWSSDGLFAVAPIRTALLRTRDRQPVLELTPAQDLRRPDVLVYWSAVDSDNPDLSVGAFLLGRLNGTEARRFALPQRFVRSPGRVVLYSLGHQEIVDSASLQAALEAR